MKKRHKWTAEEDDFLRSYYPSHGFADTLEQCNNFLRMNITRRSLEHRCQKLRLRLSPERRMQKQLENGRNWSRSHRTPRPVGYMNPKNKMIKTESGWERLGSYLNVPKGYYAVHLDGDNTNNDPNNIRIISQSTSMRMTKNGFWSDFPEVTQTGIICCELERMVKNRQTLINLRGDSE